MKRILVTGGGGFLGSHLCERLLAEGRHVFCLDHFSTGSRANIAHLLNRPRFDLLQQDVCAPLSVSAQQIFNLACPASPNRYQSDPVMTVRTNVQGAIKLPELARTAGARTPQVYGDPAASPQSRSCRGCLLQSG